MKTVFQEMGLRKKENGLIGLEIEVEGNNLPSPEKWWRTERDGSLNQDPGASAEYVLARPAANEEELWQALLYLKHCYNVNKSKIDDSVRAGVHVHINCQDLTIQQLYTYIVLFLVFELVLVKWCGETREGNLFCLRASDAEWLLEQLVEALHRKKFYNIFRDDNLRYAAINVKALTDYGSLEFRSMRSTKELSAIHTWASLLAALKRASLQFKSPAEVILSFSNQTPLRFIQDVLGPFEKEVAIKDQVEYEQLLWEGLHNAQDVAFAVDWDKFGRIKTIGGLDFSEDNEAHEPEEDF
jgi:hypothetical protein